MNKENVINIYNGILLNREKKEILPFATTWMDLEMVTLSKIRKRKTKSI